MPVGIITDVLSVLLGGLAGGAAGCFLGAPLRKQLNDVCGFASVLIAVSLMVKLEQLPAVVLALLVGAALGSLLRLEERARLLVRRVGAACLKGSALGDEGTGELCAVAVLFCFSGTGLFGALDEGLTGNSAVLLAKSILDCFTAFVFAASLGRLVAAICAPQAVIFFALFGLCGVLQPYTAGRVMGDFSAVGGVITLMAGLRILGVKKDSAPLGALPALVLVFFTSPLWSALFG